MAIFNQGGIYMMLRKLRKILRTRKEDYDDALEENNEFKQQELVEETEKRVRKNSKKYKDKAERNIKKYKRLSAIAGIASIPFLALGLFATPFVLPVGVALLAGAGAGLIKCGLNSEYLETLDTAEYYMENKNYINNFVNSKVGNKLILQKRSPYKALKKVVKSNEKLNIFNIVDYSVSINELKEMKDYYTKLTSDFKKKQEGAERQAQEEAERIAKEEAARKAKEEAERKEKEEEAKRMQAIINIIVEQRVQEEVEKRMQALANTQTVVEVPTMTDTSEVNTSTQKETTRKVDEEQRLQEMLDNMTPVYNTDGRAFTKSA
jgi:hypothetical protein